MKLMVFVMAAAMAIVGLPTGRAASQTEMRTATNGVTIPPGYRDWGLIAVAREEGKLNDLRAVLGNDIAIRASREGLIPYPDGAIIARLAWDFEPLRESARAFGQSQSHVSGHPKNGLQFMVKDASRYGSTGGWGFAQFDGGKPSGEAVQQGCFACHKIVEDRDLVFNRYASAGPGGAAP